MSESADERLQRDETLTQRLHDAVFVSDAAAKHALCDGATQLRIELLRGVLISADHAMAAEGIGEPLRDRIAHQIIFGEPPKDPAGDPDEQIALARAEEEAALRLQIEMARKLPLPFRLPDELLASRVQHARNLLGQLQDAVAELNASRQAGDDDAAWDIAREAAEWAMSLNGHPGERHGAYLVALKEPVEHNEAEQTLRLLLRVRGVIAVEPVEEDDHAVQLATARVKDEVSEALYGALNEHWYAPKKPSSTGKENL